LFRTLSGKIFKVGLMPTEAINGGITYCM